MAMLAGLCLFGGIVRRCRRFQFQALLQSLVGAPLPGAGSGPTPFSLVAFNAARSIYDAPTIAIFLLISGTLTAILVHRIFEPPHQARARRGIAGSRTPRR